MPPGRKNCPHLRTIAVRMACKDIGRQGIYYFSLYELMKAFHEGLHRVEAKFLKTVMERRGMENVKTSSSDCMVCGTCF
jgi:hypothetical protein